MKKRGCNCFLDFFSSAQKRAQLTIFVLIAILIFIAIIGFSFYRFNLLNRPIEGSENVLPLIAGCVDFTSKNSLFIVSYQGGYNSPPEKYFHFSPTFFPYYYYEGVPLTPSLKDIEKEMANYVAENIGRCFNVIESDFNINYDVRNVDVQIMKSGVEYTVDSYVTLTKNGRSMRIDLSKLPYYYETRLYDLHKISSFFIQDQLEDPDYYCISCLTTMASEAGIRFYLFPLVEDVYIIMAFEEGTEPVVFNFVNKYLPENGA